MPAVLIEAGLAALPSVASAVEAIPEIVVDGVTGIIAAAGDVDAFRAAISRLIADPGLRSSMGACGRERSSSMFSIEVVAQQWLDVLSEVARFPLR